MCSCRTAASAGGGSTAPANDDDVAMVGPFWDCTRAVMKAARGYADELTFDQILKAMTTAQFSIADAEGVSIETVEKLCADFIHSMKHAGGTTP